MWRRAGAVRYKRALMAANEHLDPLELITVGELARLAKLSRWTIKRDIDAGRLRVVYLGRSVRVPRVEAERYLTEGWKR